MGKETHSHKFGKNLVVPAKAGMTEGYTTAVLMLLPTKCPNEPQRIEQLK
jgi:hypothetical protein